MPYVRTFNTIIHSNLSLKPKWELLTLWCWKSSTVSMQCDAEITKWNSSDHHQAYTKLLWPLQLRGFCRVHWALNYITKALIITCSRGLEVFTCDFTSAPWCQLLQYAAHKCTLKLHNDTFHSFCNSPLSITPISVFNEATVKFVIKNHCFWYVFILLSNNHSSLKCS